MRLLLDTHVLLWWLDDAALLPSEARRLIADPENTIFVSVASLWEIRIKQSLGKLVMPEAFDQVLQESGFEMLSIDARHANAVVTLPLHHRDPFDRMLLAQAREENLLLLTSDRGLEPYGNPVRIVC
jgi:PIN domain nuclease of toxin-antitoxin system